MANQAEGPNPGATIHQDTVVPACEPWSAHVKQGDRLRIVDLEGQQAVDFLCYNAADPADRYNAANTIKLNNNIYLGADSVLWSVRARRMMTIVEDTCGNHDTLYGCCSIEIDEVRFNVTNSRGCQSNFEAELSKHGLGEKDIVANINFFMNVPVAGDGAVAIADGLSKPGDHVDLRAEMDVLAVLSNCPERDNAAAGYAPTPIRVIHYSPA
jgi:urea carboxylase-associated protein 1